MTKRGTAEFVHDDIPLETRMALLEQAFGVQTEWFKWLVRSVVTLILTLIGGIVMLLIQGGAA